MSSRTGTGETFADKSATQFRLGRIALAELLRMVEGGKNIRGKEIRLWRNLTVDALNAAVSYRDSDRRLHPNEKAT